MVLIVVLELSICIIMFIIILTNGWNWMSIVSEISQSKCYEWVKYRDQQVAFPNDNFVLGRYLGPSTDIGPAMTCKLLNNKGNYIHRSTLRALTADELGIIKY